MDELRDLATSFRRNLRAEGKSPHTLATYLTSVEQFCEWLESEGLEPTLAELTRTAVQTWLVALQDSKSPATVQTRYAGLQRFCNWLVREEILPKSPMAGMSEPTVPIKPVPVLTDNDLAKLLRACAGKGFYSRRDEAIIRLLLDCGLRASELCGILLEGVDLDNETIVVLGKGNKVRHVYPSSKTIRAVDRYIRERRTHPHASRPELFLSQKGDLSRSGLRALVEKRARQAGIKHVHPHQLRHTFASDFLINGGQERDLMRLAGWRSTTMLARYGLATADARAKEAARRLNRGDRV
jgi:site-specific recombinase XerD